MTADSTPCAVIRVRSLRPTDVDDVISIDAMHTAERKPEYWQRVFREFLQASDDVLRVGLAATRDDGDDDGGGSVIGYVLAEVRAFEFGSPPCGWIFAVGIEPTGLRAGVGSALLREVCTRFRAAGVKRVRTMVQRNNVGVLSFFRANGFEGGSFVQLELDLDLEESS